MYSSIGINLQKQINYLDKKIKIPEIKKKKNCPVKTNIFESLKKSYNCCSSKKHNNDSFYEEMKESLCPVKKFMTKNKNQIAMLAGVTLITLVGVKFIKKLL